MKVVGIQMQNKLGNKLEIICFKEGIMEVENIFY